MLVVKLGLDIVGDVAVLLKLFKCYFCKADRICLHIIWHVHIPDDRGLHYLCLFYLLWREVSPLDVDKECYSTLHGVHHFCGVVDFVRSKEDTRTEIGL